MQASEADVGPGFQTFIYQTSTGRTLIKSSALEEEGVSNMSNLLQETGKMPVGKSPIRCSKGLHGS